jgi:hypothetical protein
LAGGRPNFDRTASGCRTLALFKGADVDLSRFSISIAPISLREKQKGRMEHPAFPINISIGCGGQI